MSSPVTPNDFKSVIADPSDKTCGNFNDTLLRFPVLIYKLVNWLLTADGNLSAVVLRQITPPGTLLQSFSQLVPDGYLNCNGGPVLRSAYPELFAAIGTTYGAGDGSTTFLLPNCRDRFLVTGGNLYALGATGGEVNHILTIPEIPAHTHTYSKNNSTGGDNGDGGGENGGQFYPGTTPETSSTGGSATGGSEAHNNMPPYFAVYTYIKT